MLLSCLCFYSTNCAAEEEMIITDMAGRQVTLQANPDRIICISPGTLRLILYVDGGNKVVGVEDIEKANPTTRPYWIAHKELHGLPPIGPGGPNTINKEPDLEKILAANPDMIFIDGGGNELVRQDYAKKQDFYKGLKAFREGRVYVLHSFNWYMTNLGTVIADAYTVGKLLYPDRFKDINPEEKADQIYEFLVGKPVYKEMSGNFGKIGTIPDYLR